MEPQGAVNSEWILTNPASLRQTSLCLSPAFREKETLIHDCSSLSAQHVETSALDMSLRIEERSTGSAFQG